MHQPDLPLLNKTILITGAARRIGRELALGAARAGANILLHHAHSPGAAEETAKRIQDLGRKVEILPCDFSNPRMCSIWCKPHGISARLKFSLTVHPFSPHLRWKTPVWKIGRPTSTLI